MKIRKRILNLVLVVVFALILVACNNLITSETYTITWQNYDGEVLEIDEDIEVGVMPIYDGEIPTKAATSTHEYAFIGWSPELSVVSKDQVYVAVFEETQISIETYTITWQNYDGEVLEIDEDIEVGVMPIYDGEIPTKAATSTHEYAFIGWSPELSVVSKDQVYVAVFEETQISIETYTITWQNYDGEVLEIDEDIEVGVMPIYDGEIPTKAATSTHEYAFIGWSPELSVVSKDQVYVAVFEETQISIETYTITWQNYDGEVLEIDEDIEVGVMPIYDGEIPTKAATSTHEYAFIGWSPELSVVSKDQVYVAVFEETQISIETYTITWQNYDGEVLEIDEDIEVGVMPEYNGENPAKKSTSTHSYTFVGWSPELSVVSKDQVYVAVFEEIEINSYLKLSLSAQDTYRIVGFTSKLPKNLIIPKSYNGKFIVSIGNQAFSGAKNLETVRFEEGSRVTSIGDSAFYGVSSLTSIVIPNSVTSIGDSAFSWTNNLETVRFEEGSKITSIGIRAFHLATGLTSIVIPNSVINIGNQAFSGAKNLETIRFEEGSRVTSIGDSAFSGAISLTSIVIPNSVTSIGVGAFNGASSLTSIVIPNSVTSIGRRAFFGAIGLTSIVIPNSVTSIGEGAFTGASNLESMTIPFVGQSRSATDASGHFGYIFENLSYAGGYSANGYYLPTKLKEVIITDAISIGDSAFSGAISLTSIVIPNSVKSIGAWAFNRVSGLTSIVIPNSVTSIGRRAFSGAIGLTSIVIPNSVTSIGEGAFTGASNLESMTIPFVGQSRKATETSAHFGYIFGTSSYPGSYYANGYYLPTKLKEVIITDAISIGNSAFSYASSLTSIVIPNSVTTIGNQAFEEARNLETIIFEEGSNLRSIGNYAFRGASSLTSIVIPNSVKSIGAWAFRGASSLETIIFEDGSNLTSIGSMAFSGAISLTSIVIPNSVTSIGVGAFNGTSNLVSILVSEGNNFYFSIEGVLFNKEQNTLIKYPAGKQNTYYVIPNSVISIESWAFSGAISLINIGIPNSITNIGNLAFSGASSLTSIVIPNSVTSIGSGAFTGASNLESMTIPFIGQSRKATETSAHFGYIFETSSYPGSYYANGYHLPTTLKEVIITDAISVGDSAFSGASSLTSIVIPNSVTSIGSGAFNGTSNLVSILVSEGNNFYFSIEGVLFNKEQNTLIKYPAGKQNTYYVIPNSVTSIGERAFNGASGLTSIVIPNSVTTIGNQAFEEARNLETIMFEEGSRVTSIGDSAFSGAISLTSIVIPNSVTTIGNQAFEEARNLETIMFEEGSRVTSIGDSAFSGAISLTSIVIPNSVTTIGNQAFEEARNLETIMFEEGSRVTSIGDSAFSGAISLTSIVIPNSVTTIGNQAFEEARNLETIMFEEGSRVTSIGDSAFSGAISLTSIVIPNSVTTIGNQAFEEARNLETIMFEEGSRVTSIGDSAFSGAISLTSIVIPNSVTSIGSGAFNGTSNLVSILVSEGNNFYFSIEGVLFNKEQNTLIKYPAGKQNTYYVIPNSVTSIGERAFNGASGLTSIVIPNSVTTIGNQAFEEARNLETIMFEEGSRVTSIGDSAFSGAISLTSIVIPNSVTTIGDYAFNGSSSITIFAETSGQSVNWSEQWNPDSRPVYWQDQWYYDENGNPTPNE